MTTKDSQHLSIIDVVETLSNIADLDFEQEIGVTQKHELVVGNERVIYKTVHWLHPIDGHSTIQLVRETFRVVLHYLRQFYRREYSYITDQKTVEGIKTIMVLVDEAAKKLDKYTDLFHQTQRVTEFKEYKQLQDFYLSKIARKIDEGLLSQWILGLSLGKSEKQIPLPASIEEKKIDTQHVFIDLESVKKDTEYELFFIRKEDGSRFFSPRLLRNIKLVCDFRSYFGELPAPDPLEGIKHWMDSLMHTFARQLVKLVGQKAEQFFHEVRKIKENEIIQMINKALFALMLSSHSQNLIKHHPRKTCAEYFEDFRSFLRDILRTKTYQKWLTHPPKESNEMANDLLDIIHILCRGLCMQLQSYSELEPVITSLIHETEPPAKINTGPVKLWQQLALDYQNMSKLIKKHPNGPLFKVLEILEENAYHVFDPLIQHNMPSQLFDLYMPDQRISLIRLPAPIHQEVINRATVGEEFKGALNYYSEGSIPRRHLLINLQDRTSWREYARCLALEQLQYKSEFEEVLCVVTLAIDTDFFNQQSPYHDVNHMQTFLQQFKEHLLDDFSGYYFPLTISKQQLTAFIDQALPLIHHMFFSSKNVLIRESRLDFIEIFYLLLQLKLMDWIRPTTVSLTCKDAIDTGPAYSAELFVFLKMVHAQEWTIEDTNFLNFMLYAPALMTRERVMRPDRFHRLISVLKTIENAQYEHGIKTFFNSMQAMEAQLFEAPFLQAHLTIPR
jgi:hypothetical protein